MARRTIVTIDEEKCDGCGQCIVDCQEGALQLIDGKARVVKESYCDGLGACLGSCPLDAITIEERDADEFDQEATDRHLAEMREKSNREKAHKAELPTLPRGCPGSAVRQMQPEPAFQPTGQSVPSQLSHWPVQLKLVPSDAPFLKNADLLLVADCVPFAMADFHDRFLRGRAVVVGCPKLDNSEQYIEKLGEMIAVSSLRSLTIIHMEVPCCNGLSHIARLAMETTGSKVPVSEVTVGVDGRVLSEEQW